MNRAIFEQKKLIIGSVLDMFLCSENCEIYANSFCLYEEKPNLYEICNSCSCFSIRYQLNAQQIKKQITLENIDDTEDRII